MSYNQNNQENSGKGGVNLNDLMDTPDFTGQFDPADVAANKTLSLFSYLNLLLLIPLLAVPRSRYARFHVNQGLVLLLCEIVWGVLTAIVGLIFGFIPFVGWLVKLIMRLVNLVFIVLAIMGIVNAVGGRAKPLPIIGDITILR